MPSNCRILMEKDFVLSDAGELLTADSLCWFMNDG